MKKIYWLAILLTPCISNSFFTAKSRFEKAFKKGCDYFSSNQFILAIPEFEKAIKNNPQCYQAYYHLGLISEQSDNREKAIEYYTKALEVNPQYDLPHHNLATLYFNNEKYDLAKKHYQKVILSDPNNYLAHYRLSKIYFEKKLLDRCLCHLEKAATLEPKNKEVLLVLAHIKNTMNKAEEALDIHCYIDSIYPDNPSTLYDIGFTLTRLGRIKEAMLYFKRIVSSWPQYDEAHFSYGLTLLATGDWGKGWQEYEWRLIKNGQLTFPHCNKPKWDGSDLHGKIIYIRAEQGFGDTFQFIRYAKIAKEMGGTTVVAVQPCLVRYLKLCPYIDKIISNEDKIPYFDVYAPMLSFPMILKTRPDTVPTSIPYLPADATLTKHWRNQLSYDKNFKVGICWQGNPNYSTHNLRMVVAAKSIDLIQLLPLFAIPNSSFYCLQRKTGTDQLTTLPPDTQLTIFDEDFDVKHGSFMDSAAVIKNLDLVITVDTSVAHFAAGLGTPTWVLIPDPPDWRWMLERSDTPWYPNMRLFRQSTPGDWKRVMQTVSEELKKYVDTWQKNNLVKSNG